MSKQLEDVFGKFGDIFGPNKQIERSKIHFDNHSDIVKAAEVKDLMSAEERAEADLKTICSTYQILLNKVVKKLSRNEENPPTLEDFERLGSILNEK